MPCAPLLAPTEPGRNASLCACASCGLSRAVSAGTGGCSSLLASPRLPPAAQRRRERAAALATGTDTRTQTGTQGEASRGEERTIPWSGRQHGLVSISMRVRRLSSVLLPVASARLPGLRRCCALQAAHPPTMVSRATIFPVLPLFLPYSLRATDLLIFENRLCGGRCSVHKAVWSSFGGGMGKRPSGGCMVLSRASDPAPLLVPFSLSFSREGCAAPALADPWRTNIFC